MRKFTRTLVLVAILAILIIGSYCIRYVYLYLRATKSPIEYITILKNDDIDHFVQSNKLLDLDNFQFLIKNELCEYFFKPMLALIIVHSYAGNDALRAAQRNAISQTELAALGMQRIFILAALPEYELFVKQAQLVDEQSRYGDLLQGNFLEAYRNLSYKHVMGLKYAATACKKAKFIIKADDDTIFDAYFIRRHLDELNINESSSRLLLAGFVMKNLPVKRQRNNKWYVSAKEYTAANYPNYLSGWLYITNSRTATLLTNEAARLPFFWIDDVWISGIVRTRLNIPLLEYNDWFATDSHYLDCCVRDIKQFNYLCDYAIGPSANNFELIIAFSRATRLCNIKACDQRPANKKLKETCLAWHQESLPAHGLPQIVPLKLG